MTSNQSDNRFLYILSTGRCGTQWLASVLKELYSDCAVVEHEPLGPAYNPKQTLRSPATLAQLTQDPVVGNHLDRIDAILTEQPYIECGWPAFAAVPLFRERFGDRLRVIQLTRHPVWTALSYQTVNHYQLPPGDQWLAGELDPWDAGITFSHYRQNWDALSPYEKSLFQWLEIHTWSDELRATYPNLPFATIRMEDLFSSAGDKALDQILDMAGLPQRQALYDRLTSRVDAHQQGTTQAFDWQQIHNHPAVIQLAERLGYRLDDIDTDTLAQRYNASLPERLQKHFKAFRRRLKQRIKDAL